MSTLHAYLSRRGITQEQFADEIGVGQAMVSKLARGLARPSIDVAIAIERVTEGAVPATSWGKDHRASKRDLETKGAA